MNIQTVKITNYKAFLGTHKIAVGGKNLFIYGENGSGKTSFYYALKDFFQSSIEDIDLAELEHIAVAEEKRGRTAIEVTFKPDCQGRNRKKSYHFDANTNDSRTEGDTSIRDGNRLKSFLTYKHLLGIHHLKKHESINLFDLLVKGVLKHFKYSLTNGKELGELWAAVEDTVNRTTGREYNITKKKNDVKAAIRVFNEAFGELFKPDSPEYILKHARPLLQYFNHNVELDLNFPQVRPNADCDAVEGNRVDVELKYAGKKIETPHLFLNEARLSAIAISIYLGMIKRHVQGIPCKVLFLDDIFIGLDIGNRLPLLKILEREFPEYQIFITTYDKPWYEYAKGFLDNGKWKTMEFYAQTDSEGFEIPFAVNNSDLIAKAKAHLAQSDYKAAAVYTRSAFEKLIRKHCEKKGKKVVFKSRLKDHTTAHFWDVIKDDIPDGTKTEVETYRALVLNPFSHYTTNRHEIKSELKAAIAAVETLKTELAAL